MKTKRWDRTGIVVCAALNVLALALLFIWAMAPNLAAEAGRVFARLFAGRPALQFAAATACVALAAFLCGGVGLLLRGRPEPEGKAAPVELAAEGDGCVRIAAPALEALVRGAVGDFAGAEQYGVRVNTAGGATDVTLELRVSRDADVADLAQAAQKARENVRRALEEMAGLQVGGVSVVVAELTPGAAQPQKAQDKG